MSRIFVFDGEGYSERIGTPDQLHDLLGNLANTAAAGQDRSGNFREGDFLLTPTVVDDPTDADKPYFIFQLSAWQLTESKEGFQGRFGKPIDTSFGLIKTDQDDQTAIHDMDVHRNGGRLEYPISMETEFFLINLISTLIRTNNS